MILKLTVAILVGILGISTSALAIVTPIVSDITLSNGNSSVSINPDEQAGIFNWTVELTDQMAQSAYWYRIGAAAAIATPLSSLAIDTQRTEIYTDTAILYYTGASFDLQIMYSLGPNGPGGSDIAQSIMITNKTSDKLDFHLFEYVNFDLNGTAPGETAAHSTSSFTHQTEGTTEGQVNGVSIPDYREIGDAETLLSKLNTQSFTNLAVKATPYPGGETSAYTGDAAFIIQWDRLISAYATTTPINQDLLVQGAPVPEPSSAVALIGALGLIIPALRRRRN